MTKPKTVSLEDLNIQSACEKPIEFEFLDEDKKGTGIFLSVLGAQSEKVRKFNIQTVNEARRQNAMKNVADKSVEPEFSPIEDDIEYSIKDSAMRLVGWRGIDQECTPENAEFLCRVNYRIREQIQRESNKISNFTKRK